MSYILAIKKTTRAQEDEIVECIFLLSGFFSENINMVNSSPSQRNLTRHKTTEGGYYYATALSLNTEPTCRWKLTKHHWRVMTVSMTSLSLLRQAGDWAHRISWGSICRFPVLCHNLEPPREQGGRPGQGLCKWNESWMVLQTVRALVSESRPITLNKYAGK